MREETEKKREQEFALSVEEAKQNLEEERKKFEEEKAAFDKNHLEEPDSGIGSRNDSAEVFEPDAEDANEENEDYETDSARESEEEIVPPRRNK